MNTEITLPVSELKNALSGLSKVVSRRATLPVLQTVKVSRQNNGQVTLQGTDLDSFVAYNFTDKNKQPVELLVPFEQLSKAVKSSGSKDEMALICEGKETKLRYYIAGSPVYQLVNTVPVSEWPPTPKIDAEGFKLDPAFGPALKQALESCSDDPSRYVLRGAFLDVTEKSGHYIVSTNGRTLFSANSFSFDLKKSLIIPDSKFLTGSDLLSEEPCFMSVQSTGKGRNISTHIWLQNSHWQFITKDIEGQYPNWKQAIPSSTTNWTRVKLSEPAINQLVKAIPQLPSDNETLNPVRLRIEQKCIWAEGRNKDDKEWTKVAIENVSVAGKSQTIILKREYLIQALKFGLDEFAVEDELTPIVFTKGGKKFVIMPINPNPKPVSPPQPKPPTTPSTTTQTERTTMARTAKIPPQPSTETPNQTPATDSLTEAASLVDKIRETLKNAFLDMNTVAAALKRSEKDRKGTEKEIESVRASLRRIQNVKI